MPNATPNPTPDPAPGNSPERSFVVQKYARLKFDQYSLIGYSMAGEETVVQVPELNVCFDIGRCPPFALSSDHVCISHGHMDHIAGVAYYLSQKQFQGMTPGTLYLPAELIAPTQRLLAIWRDIERQDTPFELIPMSDNKLHEIRRDFGIRALATHHGSGSLGYSLISIREKLKPEYVGLPGEELSRLRASGVPIQYRVEVPLITYLGDTAIGPVFEHPDVVNAEVLITECTFFEADHKQRAKSGRHLHVEQFARALPKLNCKHIVLAHVSRRTGVRRAKQMLRKATHEELLANVYFLMDFETSRSAGDFDQQASAGQRE
jgi:ribonuclease Z